MIEDRHEAHMRRAIALAREHARAGEGGPFGAVIVAGDTVVAEGWNQVLRTNDPTAHAEIVAIRQATAARGTFSLAGCALYASCEPCPMCFGAIRWARLDALYYAAGRADAQAIGFDDSRIYDEIAHAPHARTLRTTCLLSDDAREVMREWHASGGHGTY